MAPEPPDPFIRLAMTVVRHIPSTRHVVEPGKSFHTLRWLPATPQEFARMSPSSGGGLSPHRPSCRFARGRGVPHVRKRPVAEARVVPVRRLTIRALASPRCGVWSPGSAAADPRSATIAVPADLGMLPAENDREALYLRTRTSFRVLSSWVHPSAGARTWMTPQHALARTQSLGVTESSGAAGPWCLWRGLTVG